MVTGYEASYYRHVELMALRLQDIEKSMERIVAIMERLADLLEASQGPAKPSPVVEEGKGL